MTEHRRHTSDNLPAWVDRFDDAVDEAWGRALRGRPVADWVFYAASDLGDFSLIWLLLAAAQGVASDEEADAAIRFAILLAGESLLVNQGIKRLFHRPRPEPTDPRPHDLRKPLTSSFPSGHASAAMAAAHLLSRRHPKARPLYYALGAIVATSRIHVQIHHASDVVAGAAIGAGYGRLVDRLWPAGTWPGRRGPRR
ncbi:MAG: phosphatase PAP2 family protein [Acidimicrobiales bacterium]